MGGVLLLALVIRLLGITTTDVWLDESCTLLLTRVSWWDLLFNLPRAIDHPPLAFLPFKLWSMVFQAEWFFRLVPIGWGVGTVAVLMSVAGRIDRRAIIPTGLLAAVAPVPVHYSQELRVYSLLCFLAALTLWAAQRVQLQPGRRRPVIWLAIIGALAAHTHAVGLFVFPMAAAYLVVMGGRAGWRALLRPCGGWLWLLLISPMIWFCLQSAGSHLEGWWIPQISLRQARYYAEEYFGLDIAELWVRAQRPQPFFVGFILERLLILASVGLACAAVVDQRMRRPLLALLAATATYLGLMIISSLVIANMLPRTLLPAWAPVVVGLGLGGAASVNGRRFWSRIPLVLLVSLLTAAWIWRAEAGPPRRPPARALYAWMRAQLGPHDVVVCAPPGIQELTAYYLGSALPCEQVLGTSVPLVAGSPPARKVIWATEDPHWRARLNAALAHADAASAGAYSVWFVQAGLMEGPAPGNIPELLCQHHRQVEVFSYDDERAIMGARYVPVSPASAGASH